MNDSGLHAIEEFVAPASSGLAITAAAVNDAIVAAREAGHRYLLVDLYSIGELPTPTIAQRHKYITGWARAAGGVVAVAVVAPTALIDPERFGVIVAGAAGMRADVFEDRDEARQWLQRERDAGRITAMIARLWHGRVSKAKAAAYRAFLIARGIPDYRSVPGNLGVRVLEREEGDVVHFQTLTFWTGISAVRAFAGQDETVAKYYAEDGDFLLEMEPRVQHWEVVGADP